MCLGPSWRGMSLYERVSLLTFFLFVVRSLGKVRPSARPIGYGGERVGTSGCPKDSKSRGEAGLPESDDQYRVSAAVIIRHCFFAIGIGDPLAIDDKAVFIPAGCQGNAGLPGI